MLSASQGKSIEAITAYDEAIRLDPNFAVAWNNEGVVFNDIGKHEEAIQAFDEAIRLEPNYANAWDNRGTSLASQGNYGEAIKAFNEAIRLDTNNADAWYNKGVALGAKARKQKLMLPSPNQMSWDTMRLNFAVFILLLALMTSAQCQQTAEDWYNKGIAYDEEGESDKAIDALDKAIELDPEYVDAWILRGDIFSSDEKYDDAVEAYDEAIKLNPNDAEV